MSVNQEQFRNRINSKKKQCYESRRCKGMDCYICREIKKDFIIEKGTIFADLKKLNTHVVISWKVHNLENARSWWDFYEKSKSFNKSISPKIGFYIRTLGIGPVHGAHTHYLVNSSSCELLKKYAEKNSFGYYTQPTFQTPELLSYFFDRNYIKVQCHKMKIPRIRVFSGSRVGGRYGFPSEDDYLVLESQREEFDNLYSSSSNELTRYFEKKQ